MNVMSMKITPSTKSAASDCCHVRCMAWHMVNAKKALSPMLGAWAKGSFAINASSSVDIAAASAVAVNSAPLSIPVVDKIAGFTASM